MNKAVLKNSLIVTGAVALVPTLYFLVRLIASLSTTSYLPEVWDTLNWVAIGLYGLSLLMLVGILVYGAHLEKQGAIAEVKEVQNKEALKKYQSKNKQ